MKKMSAKKFYEKYGNVRVISAYKAGKANGEVFIVFKNEELGLTVTVKDNRNMLEMIRNQQDIMNKLFDNKYNFKRVAVVEYAINWLKPYLAKLDGEIIFGEPSKSVAKKREVCREPEYCNYCGKPLTKGYRDFCCVAHKRLFFELDENTKPTEPDVTVFINNTKKGGLSHAYLESV